MIRRQRAATILAFGLAIAGTSATAVDAAPAAPERVASTPGAASRAKLPGQPNVIVIKTDDQVYDDPAKMGQFMPNLVAFMAERGVTYTNSYVASPSCCQSRATTVVEELPSRCRPARQARAPEDRPGTARLGAPSARTSRDRWRGGM